jgi:putative mycofactocin binding protein MftB
MPFRLADNVQVRQESWGLLFYRQAQHKLCFVRSADWLRPAHFDGTWTLENIIDDISRRTGSPPEAIERSLSRLTDRLAGDRVIDHEVR